VIDDESKGSEMCKVRWTRIDWAWFNVSTSTV